MGTCRLERASPAGRKRLLDADGGHQKNSNKNGQSRKSRRKENESSYQGKGIGKQVQKITQDQEGIARRGGLQPTRNRSQVAKALGRSPRVRKRSRSGKTQILRPRNAAVSLRHDAHGPHAQLRYRRRRRPRQTHEWLQRPSSHGLGRLRSPGRKRRNQEQHSPARVDKQQHRRIPTYPAPLRLQLRLAPRNLHLRARVLP